MFQKKTGHHQERSDPSLAVCYTQKKQAKLGIKEAVTPYSTGHGTSWFIGTCFELWQGGTDTHGTSAHIGTRPAEILWDHFDQCWPSNLESFKTHETHVFRGQVGFVC